MGAYVQCKLRANSNGRKAAGRCHGKRHGKADGLAKGECRRQSHWLCGGGRPHMHRLGRLMGGATESEWQADGFGVGGPHKTGPMDV